MRVTLLVLVILVSSLSLVIKASAFEIYPEIDVTDFIVYEETVFPTNFRIVWSGVYDKVVNGWWCPFFWQPECNPDNYRYDVLERTYRFTTNLPQVIEYGGVRILVTYFASISIVPYASRTWWGYMEEHVKIIVNVYAYGRIDTVPERPVALDLSRIMGRVAGGDRLILDVQTTVERVSPDSEVFRVREYMELVLKGLTIRFYELSLRSLNVDVYGITKIGDYETEGFVGLAPMGSITADLCLLGGRGYSIQGKISYNNRFSQAEVDVTLTSGRCTRVVLHDIVLVPGNYTGNARLILTFKSGAVYAMIGGEAIVNGVLATASRPIVIATYDDAADAWRLRAYLGVNIQSYGTETPVSVSMAGRVKFNNVTTEFACPPRAVYPYTCETWLYVNIDPLEVRSAEADVTVYLRVGNEVVSGAVTVPVAVISPVSVYGVVSTLYAFLLNVSLGIILFSLLLLAGNHLYMALLGRQLLDHQNIIYSIMTGVVIAVFLHGLPYVYGLALSVLSLFPEYREAIAGSPLIGLDSIIGARPNEVLALLMAHYDLLLTTILVDFKIWFDAMLQVQLLGRIVGVSLAVVILIGAAFLLIPTMNAPVFGNLIPPLLSATIMIITTFIMMYPVAGVIQALTAISEFVIIVGAALFVAITLLGAVLAVIPGDTTHRYAETLLGASLLYLLGIPLLGPITYAFYKHMLLAILEYARAVSQAISPLNLPLLNMMLELFVPIVPLIIVTGYTVAATVATGMIIFSHAYLLTRTEFMAGLGSSLLRVARR